MAIDKELLEILACPSCHGDLKEVNKGAGLKCQACGLLYPVKDGIPILLIEQAKKEEK
ncbi:MAG: Trm112 family protein [Acidobacteria bacterium]|nr:Trm112 family protein [Acidobacteriota bacterium]